MRKMHRLQLSKIQLLLPLGCMFFHLLNYFSKDLFSAYKSDQIKLYRSLEIVRIAGGRSQFYCTMCISWEAAKVSAEWRCKFFLIMEKPGVRELAICTASTILILPIATVGCNMKYFLQWRNNKEIWYRSFIIKHFF